MYAQLQERVESPQFLEDMKASLHGAGAGGDAAGAASLGEDDGVDFALQFDVNDPEWWVADAVPTLANLAAPAAATPAAAALAAPLGGDDGYVMVEKEDVIDALAAFIAGYVAAHPRASSMPPEQLQRALAAAFGELRAKGQVRRLWDWGVGVYRGVAWTYGTFSAFTNPWVARLLLAAVYTSARITCGVAAGAV